MDEDGIESESSPPCFLSKNDFVAEAVVDSVCVGSAYFFIISDRLGVDVDGVDSPSSPLRLKNDGVVDGVSKVLFGSAGAANGDEFLGTSGRVELLPAIGDTRDGATCVGASPVSRANFS